MQKENIAKRINEFIYASDLPFEEDSTTRLISATYLKTILMSAFSDNSKTPPYSIIAGDFDKLHSINSKYGFDEANKCICKCLDTISAKLPDDALITRYAGDEFLFILPSVADKSIADLYIDKINTTIHKQSSAIHGLSVSLASSDSSDANSLIKMYDIADKKVFNKKLSSKKALKSDNLSDSFYDSLDTFFSAMRFSNNHQFTNEDIKNIISKSWEITSKMIRTYENTGKFPYMPVLESTSLPITCSFYNQEDARIMHEAFSNGMPSKRILDCISSFDLAYLAKSLVFNGNSNAFSKEYFTKYLKDQIPDQNYNLSLFSLSGLKLSNLANGHLQTDKKLYTTYHQINSVVDNSINFNENPFSVHDNDSFKIDLRGGDLLFITPEGIALPIKEMLQASNSSSDILKYVTYSSKHPIKAKDISSFVETAKEKADSLKDIYKDGMLGSNSLNLILSSCLANDVMHYCQNNSNYMNPHELQHFLLEQANAIHSIANNNTKESNSTDIAKESFSDIDK